MTTYISHIFQVKAHTIDLTELYLKEGAIVLVSNEPATDWALYERKLPDVDYWVIYTANPELENPEDVTPHDVIIVTKPEGLCKIFYNPDDQERECARIDKQKEIFTKYHWLWNRESKDEEVKKK